MAKARTRLAWSRTILSGSVAAALLEVRIIGGGPSPWRVVLALVVAASCVLLGIMARHRAHELMGPDQPVRRVPAGIATIIAGYAVIGLALMFT